MKTNKGTVIITFDDVIGYTTYDLYLYLCIHYKFYGKYLNLLKLKTKQEIYNRDNGSILDYLKNKRFFNTLLDKYKLWASDNLITMLYRSYYNIDEIYSSDIITNLARKGINNPIFKLNKGIKDIIIIVKYRTAKEKERKTKFIKAIYGESILIKYIKITQTYYDIIKDLPWNILITDDINTVEKLAAGDIDHKEFLLPKYGYNKPKIELVELIKQKNGILSYYEIEN